MLLQDQQDGLIPPWAAANQSRGFAHQKFGLKNENWEVVVVLIIKKQTAPLCVSAAVPGAPGARRQVRLWEARGGDSRQGDRQGDSRQEPRTSLGFNRKISPFSLMAECD